MTRRFFFALLVLFAMAFVVAETTGEGEVAVTGDRTGSQPSAAVGDGSNTSRSATTGSDPTESDPAESASATTHRAEAAGDGSSLRHPDGATNASAVGVATKLRQTPALPPAQGLDDLAEAGAKRAAREPVSITIDRLGLVNTTVRAEGVEPNGEMSVPPAKEIGWYKYGPVPGDAGSAVLAGHVAFDGVDGAFRHLDEMEVGDRVIVERQDGTTATFAVTDRLQVAKTSLPFDEIFARAGTARVALITCGGDFDYDARSYSDNVIVIAELIDA